MKRREKDDAADSVEKSRPRLEMELRSTPKSASSTTPTTSAQTSTTTQVPHSSSNKTTENPESLNAQLPLPPQFRSGGKGGRHTLQAWSLVLHKQMHTSFYDITHLAELFYELMIASVFTILLQLFNLISRRAPDDAKQNDSNRGEKHFDSFEQSVCCHYWPQPPVGRRQRQISRPGWHYRFKLYLCIYLYS